MVDIEMVKSLNPRFLETSFSDFGEILAESFKADPEDFINNGRSMALRTAGNAVFLVTVEVKDYNETFNKNNG